jgi:hypothetical protein
MTTADTKKQPTALRNSLVISVTREIFNKGKTNYETEREAEIALAKQLAQLPNVLAISRNRTDERYICDVTIGTDALSLVGEAPNILNQVYTAAATWAELGKK